MFEWTRRVIDCGSKGMSHFREVKRQRGCVATLPLSFDILLLLTYSGSFVCACNVVTDYTPAAKSPLDSPALQSSTSWGSSAFPVCHVECRDLSIPVLYLHKPLNACHRSCNITWQNIMRYNQRIDQQVDSTYTQKAFFLLQSLMAVVSQGFGVPFWPQTTLNQYWLPEWWLLCCINRQPGGSCREVCAQKHT